MSLLSQYLLRTIGACMIAAVARKLLSCSKQFSSLGNIIISIFLIFSILSPVGNINWSIDLWQAFSSITDFSPVAQDAKIYREDALKSSIMEHAKTYVWNKAQSLSMEVQIEITLAQVSPYAPTAITITGQVSPYARGQLSQFLTDELGIPKEAQTWITGTS